MTKEKVERIGIWAGIVVPAAISLMWLGALDTRVSAADQVAKEAGSQVTPVSEKVAVLDERTQAMQQTLADIKTAQAQAAADAAAAQREIIKALREHR